MRQVVLDTETTGLDADKGHRIVEIGCVELIERRRSGREFHRYLNPERATDAGAYAVTGLSDEFLRDKPKFREVADEFLAFIDGAELIIHNASFDLSFLNQELNLLGRQDRRVQERCQILDTLAMAREKYPGQKNSLDALCKRLGVESSHRTQHGALLDANLLIEVYLSMTAGQGEILFAGGDPDTEHRGTLESVLPSQLKLRVQLASGDELNAHLARLAGIDKVSKGKCVWKALDGA